MAETKQLNVRLSLRQIRQLENLSRKLALDRSAVIRMAIARLAEEEDARNPIRDKIVLRNAR